MTIKLKTVRSLALAFGLALALSPLAFGQTSTQTTSTPTDATRARSVASGEKMKIKGVVVKRDADTFTVRDLTGNDTVVREYATIHAATEEGESTIVGNNVLLMAYTHIAHNCRIGNHVILANTVNLGGHVRIDDYAIIGGGTPVHQFVTIGCHAFVGGASRVPQDVPPYVKVAGNPLRACGLNSIGMDRRGIPAEVRLEVKRAYRILYRSQLNVAQALSRITRDLKPYPEIHEFVEFVRSSERGIVR